MQSRTPLEVPRLLAWAAGRLEESGVAKPRLNAEQLLAYCTGRSRVQLYAYPEEPVSGEEAEAFAAAVRRRAAREPLQYITGVRGFRYLELAVDRRALIPRPETEMLAERAVELARAVRGHAVAVDVGTGSGCIALSLARECPAAVVHATDICGQALELARHNAARLGLDGAVVFHRGDLLRPLPARLAGRCDLVVSNPPYVREGDFHRLPPEVKGHEPYRSLVAGPDGTEVHLRLMQQAPRWLSKGGWLLMEGGEDQMEGLARAAGRLGYADVDIRPDLNGLPRVVEMRWNKTPCR